MNINKDTITNLSLEYKILLRTNKYPRPERLEAIFNYWVMTLFVIIDAGKLPKQRTLNLHQWFFNSLDLDLHKKNKKNKKNFKRKVISFLSFIPFFNNSLLPGGQSLKPSFFEKILSISLFNKLERVKVSVNTELRANFFLNISSLVDKDLLNNLDSLIPDFFFYKIIKTKLPLRYCGSMSIALDDSKPFNKIFLQSPPPFITGYIHGGFYGEYLNNRIEDLEKSLVDKYIGWGLEDINLVQNRFDIIEPKDSVISNLFLVGSAPENKILESYYGGFKTISKESNLFHKALNDNLKINYLAHPSLQDNIAHPFFINSSLYSSYSDLEIQKSLFIFDRPGHTLLYKCIYEGIPFVIIYSDHWKVLFKPRYIEFLELLASLNLFFWHSQDTHFYNKVLSFEDGKIYNKDKFIKVRNFLEGR